MNDRYFDTARTEILPWLPERVSRLLDIGCGGGATTMAVRSAKDVRWAGGVEFVPEVAMRAGSAFDRVWSGDAAAAPFEEAIPPATLDLVLCLDVLEHMPDPWSLVGRVSTLLAPQGRLIVSVPNIRNSKFLWRLAVHGDFRYRDAGLLDRTHLRFFVRSTAIELATCGGLGLVAAESATAWAFPDARWWLSRASGRFLDEWMAKQWLVVAEKPGATAAATSPA